MDWSAWLFAGMGAAAALGYGLFYLRRAQTWPRALVKTAFMAGVAGALIVSDMPATWLICAVIVSALGDFFLAWDDKRLLPLGILSFLIAQLLYLFIFALIWFHAGLSEPVWVRYAAMALIVTATIGFLIWMGPKLGPMALAVIPYSAAITAMAVAAFGLPWSAWPAMAGAALFVVSDLVLAAELFLLKPDAPQRRITAPVVWWTYAAAQAGIVTGVLIG